MFLVSVTDVRNQMVLLLDDPRHIFIYPLSQKYLRACLFFFLEGPLLLSPSKSILIPGPFRAKSLGVADVLVFFLP